MHRLPVRAVFVLPLPGGGALRPQGLDHNRLRPRRDMGLERRKISIEYLAVAFPTVRQVAEVPGLDHPQNARIVNIALQFATKGQKLLLSDKQNDALKEMINIGVGKGAAMLNAILDTHINLEVPFVSVLTQSEFFDDLSRNQFESIAAVNLAFKGDLSGNVELIFPRESAVNLVAALTDSDPKNVVMDTIRSGTLSEIGNIVINAIDMDVMLSFYSDVLQLKAERLEEFRAGSAPFPSVRLNADTIIDLFPKELWQKTAQAGPGRVNLNQFCIALPKSEWDGLGDRLKVHGVAITEGPVQRWGAHGTGTSMYFLDPEGTMIEARHYESAAKGK